MLCLLSQTGKSALLNSFSLPHNFKMATIQIFLLLTMAWAISKMKPNELFQQVLYLIK